MRTYFFVLFIALFSEIFAQPENLLFNGSFEADGVPSTSMVPLGWYNGSIAGQSPTDLHGNNTDFFKVNRQAADGELFVGMVTRSNGTWESLGQLLPIAMQKDSTYTFSLYLSMSPDFSSITQKRGRREHFAHSVILRVWGKSERMAGKFLLAETPSVDHFDWKKYEMTFVTTHDFKAIILEVYYKNDLLEPYNGNILVDNCLLSRK
jgi:hypothetical protein